MKTLLVLSLLTGPCSPCNTRVLAYGPGVMENQVVPCRIIPRRCAPGEYVPGFRLRTDVDGYTAVRYTDRWMVGRNVAIVASVYSPSCRCQVIQRLQVVDWQQRRHATKQQRLEVDGGTAARLGFAGSATYARIIRVEVGWR